MAWVFVLAAKVGALMRHRRLFAEVRLVDRVEPAGGWTPAE